MALWPFRRKSRRKRSSGGPSETEVTRGRGSGLVDPPRSQTGLGPTATAATTTGPGDQLKKRTTEPARLRRRTRTYSFSPGRNDSVQVGSRLSTKHREDQTSALPTVAGANPAARRQIQYKDDEGDKVDSGFSASGEEAFYRVPTLHSKRDGDQLPRKKSSKKRRKEDRKREAEVKAMAKFLPTRAVTGDWSAAQAPRNDSRRVRTGGFGFRRTASQDWDKENRVSDISLPTHASDHSSLSTDSGFISFKVSTLEALAPRPTLRYAAQPRAWTSSGGGGGLGRRGTEKRKAPEREPIPEATLRAHKRVDDLADELSASDLREVMERDQRRRDRKRQKDAERLERRIARQAEKQKLAEAAAAAEGRESPPNLARGILGREEVGLGIDPASAIVTSSRRRDSDASRQSEAHGEGEEAVGQVSRPHPLDVFHRPGSVFVDGPIPFPLDESAPEPLPELPSGVRTKSFIHSKISRSKSPQTSDGKTEPLDTPRRASDLGSTHGPRSWTSFFRWGKNKRASSGGGGPSSFSNTSRDSMQLSQVPTLQQASAAPRRMSSGVPKRTKSRFREDLPELPISPPDSRIQSLEADQIPPTIAEASPDPNTALGESGFEPTAQDPRYDTPTSAMEIIRDSPVSSNEDGPGVSPEPGHTMSLASMDSEGSWLSGRLGQRRSSNFPPAAPIVQFPHRESGSGELETTHEDASIVDDEYLSRVTRNSASVAGYNRKSTGEARPSSDEEDDARWGSMRGAQHPTVVHGHTAERMKSREGLLNSFGEEAESDGGDSPVDSPIDEDMEGEGLQRATSINLGKNHVRHISAGSAKLLNLTPRNSVDKRRSVSPRPGAL